MQRNLISFSTLILGIVCCCAPTALAADEKQSKELAIIGLFSPDREQDLRDMMANVPEFQLAHVDYDNARVTFSYDVASLFAEQKPRKAPTASEVEQRINSLLARASSNTFALKLTPSLPKEKLTRIELNVGILDCKGCQYAAYLAVMGTLGMYVASRRLGKLLLK